MSAADASSLVYPAPRRTDEARIWVGVFGAATILGLIAVGTAPLAAYVWLIAAFGLPHVVSEMRYCDERFSGRASRAGLAAIGLILAALATTRLLGTSGIMAPSLASPLELGLGATLAATAALGMRRARVLGFAVAILIVTGALYAPLATFLIWAWLHNLTPLGFIAEALKGRTRIVALAALSVPFFIVPAFVALGGLDRLALALFGHDALDAPSAFGAGATPLSAYLPRTLDEAAALPLFQAAVIAQIMHYVAVIVVLPRLSVRGAARPGRLIGWPRFGVFYALLAGTALVSVGLYGLDYTGARSAYGLAATLHSWIELPIFLVALGGGFRPGRSERQSRPEQTRR